MKKGKYYSLLSVFLIASLCSYKTFAQPTTSEEPTFYPYFGIAFTNTGGKKLGYALQPGLLIKNRADLNLTFNGKLTNSSSTPLNVSFNAGYRAILAEKENGTLILLTSSLGYSITTYEDLSHWHTPPLYEIIEVKEKRLNYSIEIASQQDEQRFYLSAAYNSHLYISIGAKRFINLKN